ncbi:serine hydrolase domain-containing protein [Catenuloplanes japonicus]|uniref:serine hydrolase domain-containing protein n=1 Tax=Catenuloplanes japonicus TaxID=33876 RepID=UPI00068DF637|nr:serine hydrolase domain-containing protein [Catenuloplanes japonicus]
MTMSRRELLQGAAVLATVGMPAPGPLSPLVALGVTGALATAYPRRFKAFHGVRPDARFRIASARKAFLATVVLQLAAEGRLALDGPAPDARFTIRQLLQHTTGLQDDMPDWSTPEEYLAHRFDVHTREEWIARAQARPPAFAPGDGWLYSNAGYLLAAQAVERATGRSLRREITDRILRPLDLRGTTFPGRSPYLPSPHPRAFQDLGGVMTDVTVQAPTDPDSIVSTADDLSRFFRALLGGELLPARWLAEMQRTVPVSPDLEAVLPGLRYGLGLMRRPLPGGGVRWGHDGGDAGFIIVTGVSSDGARSAVVLMSTALAGDAAFQQQHEADWLVERFL